MEDMGHGNGAIQQMNLDDVSPATRLLEKRRQMFEVQEALEMQKKIDAGEIEANFNDIALFCF